MITTKDCLAAKITKCNWPYLKGLINVYMCIQFEADITYRFVDSDANVEREAGRRTSDIINQVVLQMRYYKLRYISSVNHRSEVLFRSLFHLAPFPQCSREELLISSLNSTWVTYCEIVLVVIIFINSYVSLTRDVCKTLCPLKCFLSKMFCTTGLVSSK